MELDEHRAAALGSLAAQLGIETCPVDRLNQAFCHSSYVNENGMSHADGNERLEFLGDSVLGLIVSEYLYSEFPDSDEGFLSKVKSLVVSRRVLAECARRLNLGEHLALGRGEETSGGRFRESILADTLESLVGAIYLTCGYDLTRRFVLAHLGGDLHEAAASEEIKDPKSYLQEYAQRDHFQIPRYRVVRTEGPDHDKRFEVEVTVRNGVVARGEGRSKKSAEQSAARQAIERLARGQADID